MKIIDVINEKLICLDLKSTSKKTVVEELASILKENQSISEIHGFIQAIEAREEIGSTGFGYHIAIPHAKTSFVNKTSIVFGRSIQGIDYDSIDGEKAHLFFMIAAPSEGANIHLQILAKLSKNLIYDVFRQQLMNVSTKEEVLALIDQME